MGAATMSEAALSSEYWAVCAPTKKDRPSGAVRRDSVAIITNGSRNSFQVHMKDSIARVSSAGRLIGSRTRTRVFQLEAPSMAAASRSAGGVVRKKARIKNTPKDRMPALCGKISDQ